MLSKGDQLALYREALTQAVSTAEGLMRRMLQAARSALQERDGRTSDYHERNQVSHALYALMRHEDRLAAAYPKALADAIALTGESGRPLVRHGPGLRFDQIERLDDNQLRDQVELARAHQSVQHAAEVDLGELDALISAAQGLSLVQPERNPLRPDAYLRALYDAVATTQVGADVSMLWMRHLCDALGQELGPLYVAMSDRLSASGLVPLNDRAASAVTIDFEPLGSRRGDFADSGYAAGMEVVDGDGLLTVDKLRWLLSGDLGPASSERTASAASDVADSAFRSTEPSGLHPLSPNTRPGALTGDALRARLRHDARGVLQVLALEVVELMLKHLSSDARLLPDIQEQVRALEPSLLRLSLIEPRFFVDRAHPARRLLDEVVQRGLAFDDIGARGLGNFLKPVQAVSGALTNMTIDSAMPFEAALSALQKAWRDRAGAPTDARIQAAAALRSAEQRHLLEQRFRADIVAAPEAAQVGAEVMAFCSGPWARVLAHAVLADRQVQSDPGGYHAAMHDLWWCAQPQLTRHQGARLQRVLPQLLDTLHKGLKELGWRDAPLGVLTQRLRLLAEAAHPGLGAVAPNRGDETVQPLAHAFNWPDDLPWMTPAERDLARYSTTLQAAPSTRLATVAGPGLPSPTAGTLELQSWVDVWQEGQPSRMQLIWTTPHNTLCLFADGQGQVLSLPRKVVDAAVQHGELPVVANLPLVDAALDAVARQAMRNSLDVVL
jgi:hypothetical protein